VEWCRTRARHLRWVEEVGLLREEMRRVLAFMVWHEKWWNERRQLWNDLSAANHEGMVAYAARQAALRHTIHEDFKARWDALEI